MNQTWLIAGTGAGTLLLVVAAYALLRMMHRQQRMRERVQLSRGIVQPPVETGPGKLRSAWSRVPGAIGQMILRTGLLSSRTRAELDQTLASAGLRGRPGLEMFVGSKIALVVGLPLLALLALQQFRHPFVVSLIIPTAATVAGLLLPDCAVRYRRDRYVRRVDRGLPEALDLMVICSQAGLGLTPSIVRVADEMQRGDEAIGAEFAITANDLRFISDTRLALTNMGSRTGVPGLVRLGTALVQSQQYGTPLATAMRMLSAELRQEMLTRFEARAARLGVLLTLPMIVFILPCVFLVVGGPAMVQVFQIGGP